MSDKDVQRNVRSSGEEGIQTPTEKHFQSVGEKENFPVVQTRQAKGEKEKLLNKFRHRELIWRKKESKS